MVQNSTVCFLVNNENVCRHDFKSRNYGRIIHYFLEESFMEKASTEITKMPAGFYLVTTDTYQKELLTSNQASTATLSIHWETLPFLSLRENIQLGVLKHNRAKIFSYLQSVELSPLLLKKSKEDLSNIERIKLQFVHFFLQEKEIFFLDQSCQEVTISEKQWLLNFCHQLVEKKQRKVFLFSKDEQLIHIAFIDAVL